MTSRASNYLARMYAVHETASWTLLFLNIPNPQTYDSQNLNPCITIGRCYHPRFTPNFDGWILCSERQYGTRMYMIRWLQNIRLYPGQIKQIYG